MLALLRIVGSVTTKHGLVHAVQYSNTGGRTTVCKRVYTQTPFDEPRKTITCLWCVIGTPWPSGVSVPTNPCAEVELEVEPVPYTGPVSCTCGHAWSTHNAYGCYKKVGHPSCDDAYCDCSRSPPT